MSRPEVEFTNYESSSLVQNAIGELVSINDPTKRMIEAGSLAVAVRLLMSQTVEDIKMKLEQDLETN